MTYTYALLALLLLGGLCGLLSKLIAWGCEEPDYNAKRRAWFKK